VLEIDEMNAVILLGEASRLGTSAVFPYAPLRDPSTTLRMTILEAGDVPALQKKAFLLILILPSDHTSEPGIKSMSRRDLFSRRHGIVRAEGDPGHAAEQS
jgi:hypothetical protein